MNINRHNYEEYFLLYIDGELSPAQSAQVEAFAAQHPDLADELDMLREAVLNADAGHEMPGKDALLKLDTWDADHLTPQQQQLLDHAHGELPQAEARNLQNALEEDSLLRKEWELLKRSALPPTPLPMPERHRLLHTSLWNEESLTPLQQDLLMLAEGDLPANRRAALEAALAQDEMLRKELDLLLAARLEAETMVMPGKERLLRRQKAPVVSMLWVRRMAAAAAIAGIGWLMWGQLDTPAGSGPQPGKSMAGVQQPKQPSSGKQAQVSLPQSTATTASANTQATPGTASEKPAGQPAYTVAALTAQETTPVGEQQNASNFQEEVLQQTQRPRLTASYVAQAVPIEITQASPNAGAIASLALSKPEPVTPYSETNDDYFNSDDERVNIGGLPIRKEKLRGIYRTVTRTLAHPFEKKNVAEADNTGPAMK